MEYLKILGTVLAGVTVVIVAILLGICFVTLSWAPFDVTLWPVGLRMVVIVIYGFFSMVVTAMFLNHEDERDYL